MGQWTKDREQWLSAEQFDACPQATIEPGETDVVFAVDASFANDSTVIVAATPDKRLTVLRLWEKPIGADDSWRVPLDEVSHQLIELIEEWKPRACVFDHVANCHTKSDRYGVRVTKESRQSKRRIDAAVASIMAVDVALRLEPVIVPPKPKIF